ncbi:hypothetical protein RLON56S_01631 [Alishewanella longhuensis]
MLSVSGKWLFSLLATLSFALAAQQAGVTPGEPVQYQLSELAAHQGNTIILKDGSSWQTNMQQFGLAGTPILISGRNLRVGSNEMQLNGFSLSASYKDGTLKAQQGFKLSLLATAADGKRLMLSDNLTAYVLDSDRRFSRNWQANSGVILSEDRRTLLYLPSLQQVSVQISHTAQP